ncbi:MAG: S-layer homology domain-containing protein [Clostridia bacterium]|nr:S-layer homology domain-containing protein [Clostridia bacterium]
MSAAKKTYIKRIGCCLAVLAIIFCSVVSVSSEEPSDWAKDEVASAVSAGLVPAQLQQNYDSPVTRGQVAGMFVNLLEKASGKPASTIMAEKGVTVNENTFRDTADASVLVANALGIINGTGNGMFSPDGTLKRAQIAAIINRTAGVMGISTGGFSHGFTDITGSYAWADSELGWPVANGIVKGVGENRFNPGGDLTTEQAILITYRAYIALRDPVEGSDLSDGGADRCAEHIYAAHPELTPVNYDSPSLLHISEDMGQEYIDKLTFICDSTTYFLKASGKLSGGYSTTQIWTGPERTLTLAYLRGYGIVDPFDGQIRTIPECLALHKPEVVVIALGMNGVAFMDEEYFNTEYENLIGWIQENSPDSVIMLQSIFPITPDYIHWGQITNVSITRANSWILKIAEKHGFKYIDIHSALLGEDGNCKAELIRPDGLHPNGDGLDVILEYLRTHGNRDIMQ